MADITKHLPLRVMRFPNPDAADTDFEGAVLAEVTSFEDGITEIRFSIGRKNYYIGIRHRDLELLTPPEPTP
jgi:hypothetical protein